MPSPFSIPGDTDGPVFDVDREGNVVMAGALTLAVLDSPPQGRPGFVVMHVDRSNSLLLTDDANVTYQVLTTVGQPLVNGLIGWSGNPAFYAEAHTLPTSFNVELISITIPIDVLVSRVHTFFTTGGTNLAVGNNYLGIYDATGTLVTSSADMTTEFTSDGLITAPVTSVNLPAGNYYIGLLASANDAGTLPEVLASTSVTAAGILAINLNRTATNARCLSGPALQFVLPETVDLSAQSMAPIAAWWAGVS